jgi:hypothetical protein
MTREEAIEKARKLMTLGDSENEHESALAMARAQALLERFEIELADLKAEREAEPMVEGTWRCGGQRAMIHWRLQVASALAEANGCSLFYAGPRVTVCGRRPDVHRVLKLWQWICAEVERLARRQCVGKGSRYAHSFKVGAVCAIRAEIDRERAALRAELRGKVTETALVIVDTRKTEAEALMYSNHARLRKSSYSSGASSHDGFSAGRAAGAGVYGSAGRGSITGGGRRAIGAG